LPPATVEDQIHLAQRKELACTITMAQREPAQTKHSFLLFSSMH